MSNYLAWRLVNGGIELCIKRKTRRVKDKNGNSKLQKPTRGHVRPIDIAQFISLEPDLAGVFHDAMFAAGFQTNVNTIVNKKKAANRLQEKAIHKAMILSKDMSNEC
ncbi:uncharacterized protein ACA1_090350 [Acanthamoeba castellanii str. Neff]|uniref:Uncharacterized protein n=1 Tax=Acanthamoeba castellanii (strain ATCC 30010 / Neff) TaxID=1257118 RepID=L8GUY1_ACACF|nr:uncharacterized protein ACA1_090350 [Acanthamoeba castellanii str. Neff]ELR16737.1 hypothetical protein ACA1_090350 [Acanthamoeba castellanii str. Neff]